MIRAQWQFLGLFWDPQTQDIAEYAVMLVVILLLVIGTVKLIGNRKSGGVDPPVPSPVSR